MWLKDGWNISKNDSMALSPNAKTKIYSNLGDGGDRYRCRFGMIPLSIAVFPTVYLQACMFDRYNITPDSYNFYNRVEGL